MRKRSLSRVTLKRMILEEMMRINERFKDPPTLDPTSKTWKGTVVSTPDDPEYVPDAEMEIGGHYTMYPDKTGKKTPRLKIDPEATPDVFGHDASQGRKINSRIVSALARIQKGMESSGSSSPAARSSRKTKLDRLSDALMLVADYLVGTEEEDALIELVGAIEGMNLGIGDVQDANPYNVDSDLPEMDALEYDDLADLYDDYEDDLGDIDDEDPFAED